MSSLRLDSTPGGQDPAAWSSGRQRALWAFSALLILALGWVLWLSGEYDRWTAEVSREATLRQSFQASMARVQALPVLKARQQALEADVAELEKMLPVAADMDSVLRDITAAGRSRGLQFELFRPGPTQLRNGHAELPVAIRVAGGYHDIGAFLGDLARLPRLVTLHNLVVVPQGAAGPGDAAAVMGPGSRLLVLEGSLRAYRALDATEREQLRRQATKAAPGAPATGTGSGEARAGGKG